MATYTLRPNATTSTGSGNGTTIHDKLSDQSDATYVVATSGGIWYGNAAPAGTLPVAQFANATGTIPAGRTILYVGFQGRLWEGDGQQFGFGSGAASLRYSDNIEADRIEYYGPDVNGYTLVYNPPLSHAERADGGTSKGAWTYALVDGLKVVIGTNQGAGQSPGNVSDVWLNVVVTDPPAVPTAVTPVQGATVNTGNPTLGATMAAIATGQLQRIEWQIASNNTFTTNVKTVTEAAGDNKGSGATTEAPTTLNLGSGTWYIRARGIDQYGLYGSYSAAQSFTVTHLPTTTGHSPTGGKAVGHSGSIVNFSWEFSDPWSGDSQTARQVIVENNSSGAVISAGTKIASSAQSVALTLGTANKDIMLRWKIQVWDTSDTTAGYSPYQLFKFSDDPVITWVSPTANQVLATGQPTITWTLDAGSVQQLVYLIIYKTGTMEVVYSYSAMTSSKTHTPPQVILENNTNYVVQLYVTDTDGLQGANTQYFSTAYEAPATVTATASAANIETLGYVNVDWSQQIADGFFVDWRVYRREQGTSTWTLLDVFTDVNIRTYHDWTAGSSRTWQYAVTQTGGRSGDLLESAPQSSPPTVTVNSSHYWLINPYDESLNFKLANVVDDGYTDEFEQEPIVIIGRGRKINYGTHIGISGSLSAQIRGSSTKTAREIKVQLETLKRSLVSYYLRTPFGDTWLVSLGNITITRIAGVGTSEFVDVDVPYMEVF